MVVSKFRIPGAIRLIFSVYLAGIFFFTCFRLLFFFTLLRDFKPVPSGQVMEAFLMGLRFDTVISCYILSVPFLLALFIHFRPKAEKHLIPVITGYLLVLYMASFLACCIDIPYYHQFGMRLNAAVFAWKDHAGFVIKMTVSEASYWIYILPFLLGSYAFRRVLLKIIRYIPLAGQAVRPGIMFPVSFLVSALFLLAGSRGRLSFKSPIRTGTAYISEYGVVNNLGLNPVFTLVKTTLDDLKPGNRELRLMDDKQAILHVRKLLNITDSGAFDSPVARAVSFREPAVKANVIIVIMESMCVFKMGQYNGPRLTPVLDSLRKVSLSFRKFYSAGIHTFNGIYSTLFSFPALLKQQPMNFIPRKQFTGIGQTLRKEGYATVYFTTHDEQFDNAGGFLTANGYDRIYSEKDYPSDKLLSNMGVPDHYLFEYSIPVLNRYHAGGQKFLSVYMTGSDHGPWIIPEGIDFIPRSPGKKEKSTEYADWSIGHFLKLASRQEWFDSTLFVFVGDHGLNMGHTYDMPLSFHHVPCIFYSPLLIRGGKEVDDPGGQVDVFPTVMGLLSIPYVNNTFGIDLRREKRSFIWFSADDRIGSLDSAFYFIHRMHGSETLYRYENLSFEDYLPRHPGRADSLRTGAFAMMQAAQWMLKNEKFGEQAERKTPVRR